MRSKISSGSARAATRHILHVAHFLTYDLLSTVLVPKLDPREKMIERIDPDESLINVIVMG